MRGGVYPIASTSIETREAKITLVNTNGTVILTKKQSLDTGYNSIQLIKEGMSTGLYLVIIESESMKKSIKVIIK